MSTALFNIESVKTELSNIANWWLENTIDEQAGGFLGEIDHLGNVVPNANKGIILNSRILWFFSELAIVSQKQQHIDAAKRAFDYIIDNFDDKTYGGSLWELSANGSLVNAKKQTYAQCFCIYAFSAYYKLTDSALALDKALEYFELVEQYARDPIHGGYVEALTQEWQAIDDYRLSDKDMNLPKSMNTHLHVLEAYAALYHVKPTAKTEEALTHVIDIFTGHIIDNESHHLNLFFDMQWHNKSTFYSFGHDIEASWLLWEALEILGNQDYLAKYRSTVIALADTCLTESIGDKGQVCDEFEFKNQKRHQVSYWWVQAEALVGFLNAYQLTGKKEYADICDGIWQFIDDYHIDKSAGEWHWVSTNDLPQYSPEYKVGFWKAPYHNGRAMMELCKLFQRISLQRVS
jgi:mannobiose 2-epimerase